MKYAAHIKDESEIQSPFFDNTTECWAWIRENDLDGYKDGNYTVQGFTEEEVKDMDNQPEG